MRKLILAALPTVSLSKLKIVNMLILEFYQHNFLSDTPPETIHNKPLYTLESNLLYLLNNITNPNIDLLTDAISNEITEISQSYYELIPNELKVDYSDKFSFKFNENIIRHEIGQILNDLFVIYDIYCRGKKIIAIELVVPDRVYLEFTE